MFYAYILTQVPGSSYRNLFCYFIRIIVWINDIYNPILFKSEY